MSQQQATMIIIYTSYRGLSGSMGTRIYFRYKPKVRALTERVREADMNETICLLLIKRLKKPHKHFLLHRKL